jgi:hypothetical protein
MPIVEITLEELKDSYDWAEVFADRSSGNTTKETTEVPPGSDVSTRPASREDVIEIIAAVNGENDGEEWIGVFLLRDGRYLVAQGSCDYTGWDCQAGNSMVVASSWSDIMQFGLSDCEKRRLGLD